MGVAPRVNARTTTSKEAAVNDRTYVFSGGNTQAAGPDILDPLSPSFELNSGSTRSVRPVAGDLNLVD
jgi:hypothetical protein